MKKLTPVLIFCLFSLNMFVSQAETDPGPFLGPKKVTRLHFYVQDIGKGDNATVWTVAQSDLTYVLASGFGLVCMIDNPVTSGPEMGSGEVGRLQGMVGLADLRERGLSMLLNLVFTHGEYKGSTLSILGRNPLDDEVREVSIVGGTGAFRLASGYAVTTTYAVDDTRGVYVYDAVVLHMDATALLSRQ